jgi:hypothetical protein
VSKGADNLAVASAYYDPLLGFLRRQAPLGGRVEVPFTRTHWEAEALAPHVALARGWERQLDTRYASLFYDARKVSATAYEQWLTRQSVRFVAVPDATLDPAGRGEARLIATHPSYLRPVWHSRHWQVFEVRSPAPLLQGAASLLTIGPDHVTLLARRAGLVELNLHWTSLWQVTTAGACVAKSADGFTDVHVARAGTVRLTTRLTAAGALGASRDCAAPLP